MYFIDRSLWHFACSVWSPPGPIRSSIPLEPTASRKNSAPWPAAVRNSSGNRASKQMPTENVQPCDVTTGRVSPGMNQSFSLPGRCTFEKVARCPSGPTM